MREHIHWLLRGIGYGLMFVGFVTIFMDWLWK